MYREIVWPNRNIIHRSTTHVSSNKKSTHNHKYKRRARNALRSTFIRCVIVSLPEFMLFDLFQRVLHGLLYLLVTSFRYCCCCFSCVCGMSCGSLHSLGASLDVVGGAHGGVVHATAAAALLFLLMFQRSITATPGQRMNIKWFRHQV